MERYGYWEYADWSGVTGSKFDSPSSFSIHVKRLVNPTRKADDGWKTVKYKGRYVHFIMRTIYFGIFSFLESYKLELAKKRFEQSRLVLPKTSDLHQDVKISTPVPEIFSSESRSLDLQSVQKETASSVPVQD